MLKTIIRKKERNSRDYLKKSTGRKEITKAKKEVLGILIQSLSNKGKTYSEISKELNISKGTVHNYLEKYKNND